MSSNEIVVGVDGSEGSVAALEFAVDRAALDGADVVALETWELPFVADITGAVPVPSPVVMAEGAEANLRLVVDKVSVPRGVRLTMERVEGQASRELIRRAE